jgi:hypothetical protein
MFLARIPLARLPVACLFLVAVTSCRTIPDSPPAPEQTQSVHPLHHEPEASPVDDAPSSAQPASLVLPTPTRPTAPSIDPAAAPCVTFLATQLLIPPESISVLAATRAEWPDACLGLAADGEICAMAITPGYAVTLGVGDDIYAFRTDERGSHIRVASAPPPRTGEPLVTWRDSRSFTMMVVGTQRVAIGRRGRPLIASPLSVPIRATQLQGFLARFAPFQAQTPAGDIALRGIGSSRPTEADQRMIAEWARLVSLEARAGAERSAANSALIWTRTGGVGDVCDAIEVTRTGEAIASSCRGDESRLIAQIQVPETELTTLYGWLDRFEAFSFESQEPSELASAGGALFTARTDFRGSGFEAALEAERELMLAWIESLALRLREAALR